MNNYIGATIKELRRRNGLTQTQLGKKIGVTQSMIAAYETGAKTPKPATINRILEALGSHYSYRISDDKDIFNRTKYSFEISESESELIVSFRNLNNDGKAEALKRVQELTEIDRYKFK